MHSHKQQIGIWTLNKSSATFCHTIHTSAGQKPLVMHKPSTPQVHSKQLFLVQNNAWNGWISIVLVGHTIDSQQFITSYQLGPRWGSVRVWLWVGVVWYLRSGLVLGYDWFVIRKHGKQPSVALVIFMPCVAGSHATDAPHFSISHLHQYIKLGAG